MALVSLGFLVIIFFLCFVVAWFLRSDPNTTALSNTFAKSSATHWFGTDHLGRDLLARILYGGQISLLVALFATAISVLIGIIYGSISGFAGGKVDSIMMRIVDVLYALPFLILVILFKLVIAGQTEALGEFISNWIIGQNWAEATEDKWLDLVTRTKNIIPLFVAIGILGWLTMARIVRAQVQAVKEQEYVEAVRSLGKGNLYILFRHVLPNILGPVIIYTTLTIPSFILYEAALSYLGIGVEAPNSSWGILLSEGANYLETNPQLLYLPGIFFVLTLLSLNFLGDGLRDALDVKASKD